jgi:hypothetical protein
MYLMKMILIKWDGGSNKSRYFCVYYFKIIIWTLMASIKRTERYSVYYILLTIVTITIITIKL